MHSDERDGDNVYCKKCGNYIEEGQNVCSSCGSRIYSKRSVRRIVVLLIVFLVISVFAILVNFVDKHTQNDKVQKLFVGQTGTVEIDDHKITFTIENENQIIVKKSEQLDGIKLTKYEVIADIDIEVGVLRGVEILLTDSLFDKDVDLKWDYCCDLDDYYSNLEGVESDVLFEYTKKPAFTGRKIMSYLGVDDSYDMVYLSVSSITNNYDALEYCVIWRDYSTTKLYQDWVRAEYDSENDIWNLVTATEKKSDLNVALMDISGSYTVDEDYNPDDIIYVDSPFITVEQ